MYNSLKNKMQHYYIDHLVPNTYKSMYGYKDGVIDSSENIFSNVENDQESCYFRLKSEYRRPNNMSNSMLGTKDQAREYSLIIVVKNKETGYRIFDIVKRLKKERATITIKHGVFHNEKDTFKIVNYAVDKDNCIQAIFMHVITANHSIDGHIYEATNVYPFISFVKSMREHGYILDEKVFDFNKCIYFSSLLSFFIPNSNNEQHVNGVLYKYLHNRMAIKENSDFDKVYKRCCKDGICDFRLIYYDLQIAEMCLDYYRNGEAPKNICDELMWRIARIPFGSRNHLIPNLLKRSKSSIYVLLDQTLLDDSHSITELNDEYTVYDGKIKIYNNPSDDFREFLIDPEYRAKSSLEKIDGLIVDFNTRVIGYTFHKVEAEHINSISPQLFKTQYELVENILKILSLIKQKNDINGEKIERFNIEDSLVLVDDSYHFTDVTDQRNYSIALIDNSYYFTNLMALYDFNRSDSDFLYTQVAKLFLKYLLIMLNEKHDIIQSEEELMKRHEQTYLPALVVLFRGISDKKFNLKDSLINFAKNLNSYCDKHKLWYKKAEKRCPICKKTLFEVPAWFNATVVYEDKYAVHYSLPLYYIYNDKYYVYHSNGEQNVFEEYILKVYKSSCLSYYEEDVDYMLNANVIFSKDTLRGQDCFIPYRKAIDKEGNFIGYLYKKVNFADDETFLDLKSDTLSNLHKLKSLIRLIIQVKKLINKGLYFRENPFNHVYLSQNHKKQVQILNIDLLSKKGDLQSTIIWLDKYIRDVLSSDKFLEIDLSEYKADLDAILARLQLEANSLTKYCHIHNAYYKQSDLICPYCLDEEEMDLSFIEENIIKTSKESITNMPKLNEGGEAVIYKYEDGMVAKVFKEDVTDTETKSRILIKLLKKKQSLLKSNENANNYKFIVPNKLLVDKDSNEIFGYTMERADGLPISILRDVDATLQNWHDMSVRDILKILITMGEGIETLHKQHNIYIGDLNGSNILLDSKKNVYFIDFDGMGIDNFAPVFCTDEYIDPKSKKNQNITMEDDWYSFAIQAFYYLTNTHPFNGIYTIKEEDKEKFLGIPEKMERKISLLGNHGMKPPRVAESWCYWMNDELQEAFLNIFEGDTRESILPYLKRQYEEGEIIRISSKFWVNKVAPTIFTDRYLADEEKDRIDVSKTPIKSCKVIDQYKLVKVCEKDPNTDVIYLNEDKLLEIHNPTGVETFYNIIYDKHTKKCVIANNLGTVIVASLKNKEHIELDHKADIDLTNLYNITFENDSLYIPKDDYLVIVNMEMHGLATSAEMMCGKFMTRFSRIFNINDDGFSVVTKDEKIFEIRLKD